MRFIGYVLLTICILLTLAGFGCWAAAIWATGVVHDNLGWTTVLLFIAAVVAGCVGGLAISEANLNDHRPNRLDY